MPLTSWSSSNCPTPYQQQQVKGDGGMSYLPLAVGGERNGPPIDTAGAAAGGGGGSSSSSGSYGPVVAGTTSYPMIPSMEDLVISLTPDGQRCSSSSRGVSTSSSSGAQGFSALSWGCSNPWWAGSESRWGFVTRLVKTLLLHGGGCRGVCPELAMAWLLLESSKPPPLPSTSTAATAASAGGLGEGSTERGNGVGEKGLGGYSVQQQQEGVGGRGGGVTHWPSPQQLQAARAAAKEVMAGAAASQQQQGQGQSSQQQQQQLLQLSVAEALGAIESAAGNMKAARKVLGAALSAALGMVGVGGGGGQGRGGGGGVVGAVVRSGQGVGAAAAAAEAAVLLALRLAEMEVSAGMAAAAAGSSRSSGGGGGGGVTSTASGGVGGSSSSRHSGFIGPEVSGCVDRARLALASCLAGVTSYTPPAVGKGSNRKGAAVEATGSLVSKELLVAARRAVQDQFSALLAVGGGGLDRATADVLLAAAQLEWLTGISQGKEGEGIAAAVAVLRQVGKIVPQDVRHRSVWHEGLVVWSCGVLVRGAMGGLFGGGAGVSPSEVQAAIARGLALWARNRKLLELLVVVGSLRHWRSGLRVMLLQHCEMWPSAVAWGVVCKSEVVGVGGGEEGGGVVRYRVKGMLEKAVGGMGWAARQKRRVQLELMMKSQQQQGEQYSGGRGGAGGGGAAGGGSGDGGGGVGVAPAAKVAAAGAAAGAEEGGVDEGTSGGSSSSLSSCSLWEEEYHGCGHVGSLWKMYLEWAGVRGGGVEAARKVFFRGLHACPGDKGLWLEGLGGAVGDLGSGEAQGLMSAMEEREVMRRVEVVEVMLEEIQEQEEEQ